MENKEIKIFIGKEKGELNELYFRLDSLNKKWFKFKSTDYLIKFLEFYINLKKDFIIKLQSFR